MSFLRRVAGLSLKERVRSSAVRRELGSETLLLHVEMSQLRWFSHLIRMPPGRLPLEVFQAYPSGRRPGGRPRTHAGGMRSPSWPGNSSGSPRMSWRMLRGERSLGRPAGSATATRLKISGWKWMDGGLQSVWKEGMHRQKWNLGNHRVWWCLLFEENPVTKVVSTQTPVSNLKCVNWPDCYQLGEHGKGSLGARYHRLHCNPQELSPSPPEAI